MKTILRILKWLGILIIVIVAGFVIAVYSMYNRKFDAPYPDIKASTDSAVIARGKYLVFGPAHCVSCHTTPNDSLAIVNGEEVAISGGRDFKIEIGIVYSRNLTPDDETGIGKASDAELARVLRFGVTRTGHAIIPFMPYKDMDDRDLTALISYLRSRPAVKNAVPENTYNFMGKAVMAFMMKPEKPASDNPPSVAVDTSIEYGKYMAFCVANCRGCHTDRSLITGEFTGIDFAGGLKFPSDFDPSIVFSTPNLTPDAETSPVGRWTYEQFRDRFRQGRLDNGSAMPWELFKTMDEVELYAIYKYLRSLSPVKNDTGPYIQKVKS